MIDDRKSLLRVSRDTFVVLDYVLYDEEGEVVEATDDPEAEGGAEPVRYVHGYGTLVPGLERALVGMAPGDTREVVVPPADAYGPWDSAKEAWIDRSELPDDVQVEDELGAEGPDGEETTLRVVELGEDAVLIDTNHPLAGMSLRFDVIVREVRPASEEELAHARKDAPRPSLRVLADSTPDSTRPQEDLPKERLPAVASTTPRPKGVVMPRLSDDEQ